MRFFNLPFGHCLKKKTLEKKILGNIKYIYFERCNLGPIRNDASCVWDLASHDISTSIYLLNKLPNKIKSEKLIFEQKFNLI